MSPFQRVYAIRGFLIPPVLFSGWKYYDVAVLKFELFYQSCVALFRIVYTCNEVTGCSSKRCSACRREILGMLSCEGDIFKMAFKTVLGIAQN